jgi:hypothetical protein
MTFTRHTLIATIACLLALLTTPAIADQNEDDVLAVADQALERITEEDFVGLTDLMIDTAVAFSNTLSDGDYHVRARTYAEQRESSTTADLVERGFDPTVLVSGPIAMVWYPYDFYSNGDSRTAVSTYSTWSAPTTAGESPR